MEKINELLGIADKAVASTKTQTATVIPRPQTNEEDEDDFKYSRENLFHPRLHLLVQLLLCWRCLPSCGRNLWSSIGGIA